MKKVSLLFIIILMITQVSYSQVIQWTKIADSAFPTAVFFDENDSLWLATNDGNLYMKSGQTFENHSSGIICNNVTSADADNGLIWVGGYQALTKYNGTDYTDFIYDFGDPQNSDLASYAIYDLVAKNGKVWLAMEMGEVSYYNGTGFTHYTTADGLSDCLKTCIEIDELGNTWVGGYKYPNQIFIDHFDGTSWTNYSAADGLTLTEINTVFADSKGNIWVAGDKLMKFNGKIWEAVPSPLTGITAIEEDADGNLWLGGYNSDVYIYDGHTMTYAQNPVKYGFRPDGMAVNKKGEMYLCMDDGIYKAEEVSGTPPLKANFSVDDKRPCPNTLVQFTDQSTGNPTSWKWFFGDGDSSFLQHPTHSYADLHHKDVTLIVDNGSITDTLTKNNFVYVSDDGDDPTVVINADSKQVCEGDTVTCTASVTDGGDPPSFEWFVNGTSVLVDSTGTYSYQPDDGDQVYCILTSSSPCASGLKDTSNIMGFSVLKTSTPVTTITVHPADSICDGDIVHFSNQVINAGSHPTYQWQINGIDQAGKTGLYFTSSLLQDGDVVTCVVTSSLSCATAATVSNGITMSVAQSGQTPVISISASPSDSICNGEQVFFSSNVQYSGSIPGYQWKINGVDTAGQTNSSFITSSLQDGDQITCELTSSSGCVSSPTALSNTIDITVASSVTPSVSITANPAGTLCPETNVQFTASSTNGGAAPSYQWKVNGIDAGTNNTVYSSSTLSDNDTISCVLTSSSSCATGPDTSNIIIMDMSLSIDTSITIINSTTLQANETSAAYQWVLCDSNNKFIQGATNQTFSATSDGNYAVIITKNGCAKVSNCYSLLLTNSMYNSTSTHTISAYPNPAKEIVTIIASDNKLGNSTLIVTNLNGQTVFKKSYSRQHTFNLNVETYQPGMYIVKLVSDEKTYITRIVKTQ